MTKEQFRFQGAVSFQDQFPPKATNGRILWKSFKNKEWLMAYFQSEAAKFVGENGDLNNRLLREKKQAGFYAAIDKYYPGGIFKLRDAIGMSGSRRANGFWTETQIKDEASAIFGSQGGIDDASLRRLGRSDLANAIYSYYSGGWMRLREELGTKTLRKRNFWTPEKIIAETQKCYREFGRISSKTLSELGRSDLVNAIESKYPGGWRQLRKDLDVELPQKHSGFWTKETIEEEARRVIQDGGKLTDTYLLKNGLHALRSAVRKYPGGVKALREELQIPGTESVNISKSEANMDLDNLFKEGV